MHWFLNVVFGIGNPDLLREVNGVVTAPYITIAIASFHTLFNLVNAIILLPFVGQITNLLEKMFTHKAIKQKIVATKLISCSLNLLLRPLLNPLVRWSAWATRLKI